MKAKTRRGVADHRHRDFGVSPFRDVTLFVQSVSKARRNPATLLILLTAVAGLAGCPSPEVVRVDQEQTQRDLSVALGIGGSSEQKIAQVLTAGVSAVLSEVHLDVGGSSGELNVEIQSVTGGLPDGVVLSSVRVPSSALPAEWFGAPFETIVIPDGLTIQAGTQYAIVLYVDKVLPPISFGIVKGPESDTYSGGKAFFDSRPNAEGVWVEMAADLAFETAYTEGTPD